MHLRNGRVLSIIIVCLAFSKTCFGFFAKFTNVECTSLDKPFAEFTECRLKMVRRGVSSLAIHAKLKKVPVTNITLETSLWRKASTWQPFLYHFKGDFCEVIAKRKRDIFLNVGLEMMLRSSNINHTCPYDHDIILKNFILRSDDFRLIPFPNGDYQVLVKLAAYNDWKAIVKVNVRADEHSSF